MLDEKRIKEAEKNVKEYLHSGMLKSPLQSRNTCSFKEQF